jgi:hypothetical protein
VSVAGDPAVLADEHLIVASAFRVTDVALNHGYSNLDLKTASTLCSGPDRCLIFMTATDQVYSCLETKGMPNRWLSIALFVIQPDLRVI